MRKILVILSLFILSAASVFAGSTTNETVGTTMNVSGTAPVISTVAMYLKTDAATTNNFVLTEGSTTTLNCSGAFYDLNTDTVIITARFYDLKNVTSVASDHNRTHYTNGACTEYQTAGSNNGTYHCEFPITFNANGDTVNGNWACNVTASDGTLESYANSSGTSIDDLVAMDLEDGSIDFGSMSLNTYAPNDVASQNHTVYNWGNVLLDFLWASYNNSLGDGMSMECTTGNLSVGHLVVNKATLANFAAGTRISNSALTEHVEIDLPVVSDNGPATVIKNNANATLIYGIFANQTSSDAVTAPAGNCTGKIQVDTKAND